ncbi:hypothetical protein AVEN_209213-1, partial [Araneus ventricosus]
RQESSEAGYDERDVGRRRRTARRGEELRPSVGGGGTARRGDHQGGRAVPHQLGPAHLHQHHLERHGELHHEEERTAGPRRGEEWELVTLKE